MELPKHKTFALSFGLHQKTLAIYCKDRFIRLFDIPTGKLIHSIDETLGQYAEGQTIKGSLLYLEKLDYERRMAVEREIERTWEIKTKEST